MVEDLCELWSLFQEKLQIRLQQRSAGKGLSSGEVGFDQSFDVDLIVAVGLDQSLYPDLIVAVDLDQSLYPT